MALLDDRSTCDTLELTPVQHNPHQTLFILLCPIDYFLQKIRR